MCDRCDWGALLEKIDEMIEGGHFGWAMETLEGIRGTVTDMGHCTPRQCEAVDNIESEATMSIETVVPVLAVGLASAIGMYWTWWSIAKALEAWADGRNRVALVRAVAAVVHMIIACVAIALMIEWSRG